MITNNFTFMILLNKLFWITKFFYWYLIRFNMLHLIWFNTSLFTWRLISILIVKFFFIQEKLIDALKKLLRELKHLKIFGKKFIMPQIAIKKKNMKLILKKKLKSFKGYEIKLKVGLHLEKLKIKVLCWSIANLLKQWVE